MNRRAVQSCVFCILSILLTLFVFAIPNASAEFYVIAGSRGVGTEIKSLPYTISSPGFYYITKDLSCTATNHGITINADNVTLDLMGFSLIGPGGTGTMYDGISMTGRTNVEIRNGTVRNFHSCGIADDGGGEGHRVVNVRVKDNGYTGIILNGRISIVEMCTAAGNGNEGINVTYGSTVTGNTCYDNTGSGIVTGNGSTVTGNTSRGNGGYGIDVGYGSTVTGNTCSSNTNYGILLNSYNLVDQNTAYNNSMGNMNACATCVFGENVAP